LLLLALGVLLPRIVTAAVFLPMSIEELAQASVAVVVGDVARMEVATDDAGVIETEITVNVLATLRGVEAGAVITLREAGGSLGDLRDIVSGAARFELGEEVLLFLTADRTGRLRVNQGALGKFRLNQTAGGLVLQRSFGKDIVFFAPSGGGGPPPVISWDLLTRALGMADTARQPRGVRTRVAPAGAPRVLMGRFFEPDDGVPVDFRMNGGDATLGFLASRDAIDAAMAAWTNVDDATITLHRSGQIEDPGRVCPGPNKVIFNDPEGIIAPPLINPDGNDPGACRGELARGIQRTSRFETKSFNGIELERVSCGFLVFADGWGTCDVWTACNVAEIATHELGHVLGLGHSSEDPNETNTALSDATMYYRAHFDGRCAGLKEDDIDGARFVYPAALPPTITTTSPLQNGLPGMLYRFELEATGGSGGFVWSIVGGGFPGIDLSADGTLSGTPEVDGTSFFQVRAVDSNGDSHVKVLSFTAGTPGPAPPTATRTVTASPTPSTSPTTTNTLLPTSTPSPTTIPTAPFRCPGDCDASDTVTVDEILVLVSVALGMPGLEGCRAGDLDGSNSITVDEILQAVNVALSGC
jgi:hypothetical protein